MKYSYIAAALLPMVSLAQPVNFNREVRPILSDHCFHCHGPDEHNRKAKLRLDQADGPQGAYRIIKGSQAIKPGAPDESALWHRITADDEDDVMPPLDSHKKPLNAGQKAIIRQWLQEGAEYQHFWAFVPARRPELPTVQHADWSRQPIDLLVMRRLEQEGLKPSPKADKRTLIRRLTFDLTGLPPTRDEIAAFLADDAPDAYDKLVDRLIAKPQYGENQAKYWLDLVRFADTNGVHHDHFRDSSPYRDWVIRALNDNLPYDQFGKYQLAGDLYPEPTQDQLIASGFNRLHLIIDVGTALPEESLFRNVVDRVTAVGTAFMGLTVQCAVCHDHKYDPITTKDFYQLTAFFNNLDAPPETGGRGGPDFIRGLQQPYISLASPEQEARQKEFDTQITAAQAAVEALKKEQAAGDAAQKKAQAGKLKAAEENLKKIQNDRKKLVEAMPAAMVMKERTDIRTAYILKRGAYDNPGEQVHRDTPAFLPPLKKKAEVASRMDLAEWFMGPENPLTARVAVNRFWQQLFGVGIVKTAEDLGAQGEWPSHPDLLDFLTVSFVESGWDIKALLRQIVRSETYQQSSIATPADYERDGENRLLARGSRFRMDSEMVRDQILAASGLLNTTLYGKSVKPPQPAGMWKAVALPSSYPREFRADEGDAIYRRSVYTFWKRAMPPPQMTILNAPARDACTARRERTNTPLQALLLLNEEEYMKAARHLAVRTLADQRVKAEDRLPVMYETVTGRLPDVRERGILLAAQRDFQKSYEADAALATAFCEGEAVPPGAAPADVAAWAMVVNTIFNLDITKTRD